MRRLLFWYGFFFSPEQTRPTIWVIGNACAGINGESSFEAALLERAPGCEVWGYDFSVNSVRGITPWRGPHDLRGTQFGPEIENSEVLKARSHFHPWALGGHNAHGSEDNPKFFTLDALMKLNGACLSFSYVFLSVTQEHAHRSHIYRCTQD